MRNYLKPNFTLSIALLFCFITAAFAQDSPVMRDTVSMEPGRTHDVYYSLKNGTAARVVRDNWDIEFSTQVFDVTIRTNGAIGINLYTYPNSDISGWDNVDTTGLSTWPVLYNSDTDWETGAFNLYSSSDLDFGWGTYNTVTHIITGDSLFVIQMPDGSAKKLWIVEKNPVTNVYTFKYADLDGSSENEVTLNCNDYAGKNFVGFSFADGTFVDREPASAAWDLVFTKYMTFYAGVMWYPVTGILQNYNVQAASYSGVDTSFANYNNMALDSFNISTLGNHWYELQGGMPPTYAITDSLVYFVSDQESSIWKLVFEYYESSLGEIGFKKQLLEDHTGISEIPATESGNLVVSPNPAAGQSIDVVFSADTPGNADLAVFNIAGSKVAGRNLNYRNGVNRYQLNISDLSKGVYIVTVNSGNVTLRNKLIVQ